MARGSMRNALLSVVCAGAAVIAAAPAQTQNLPKNHFNVVGTWGNLSPYIEVEEPFWSKEVTERSNGAITANIAPITELGLKGFEVLKLLGQGVYHFGYGTIGYVAEDPIFEGPDLSIISPTIEIARKVSEAYTPVLDKAFQKQFNAKLLTLTPYPAQMIYCKPKIKSIEDLKGKKFRVYSTTLGDFVEAVGGTPVTVAFAEVVPALEKGVVDCGITGVMPAYQAKWYEVAHYVMPLLLGWGISWSAANLDTWNGLDEATKEFIVKEMNRTEDETWELIRHESEQGLICLTGVGGKCEYGEPGDMVLVKPSEADIAERDRIMGDVIVKRWAERCTEAHGPSCVENWNKTIGKIIGYQAKVN